MSVESFEKKLRLSLPVLESGERIGVAVSGGADSVSLLFGLCGILGSERVFAVTVNHNLRPEEETSGDAVHVEELCRALGVSCRRFDVPRGKIEKIASERKCGVEEAARFVRYQCFDEFILEADVSWLCLAHNKNDQVETVLMRFLQGSSFLSGIPSCRGKFIRPLLGTDRSEIEEYLVLKKIQWRTDSTNSDQSYFRNRIRGKVIPFLDENIGGWGNAVLSLSRKNSYDKDFICFAAEAALEGIKWNQSEEKVSFDSAEFMKLFPALRIYILYKALSVIKADSRIPFESVERFCLQGGDFSSCGIRFCSDGAVSVVSRCQKKEKVATETGYFAIIEETGIHHAGDMVLQVSQSDEGTVEISCGDKRISCRKLGFPFAFRSWQSGDFVLDSSGCERSCSKILDGWKCGGFRERIPFVQELSGDWRIKCVWGSLFGFPDWLD